ncbi:Protein kinase-like domain [Pseudocohnilembus persalinus]|uniref:Protein kinase-like domain n=1 Tax=Pseudocohnilembus persalinus TaxID=266149 RepID=A0A0V0R5Y4_PSEPJ|nr:Protein kinase-like domain [Pseudocohnilembus persalinus]|eukprot:KRX09884.1 Protein kinase-like domain [Pseudocohnilembus persalinus]
MEQNQYQQTALENYEVNKYVDPKDNRKVINGYKICKNIGEGAYAKVKLVYCEKDDEFYAFKKFNKFILQKKQKIVKQENGDIIYKSLWDNVLQEIKIHKTLNHENILKLHEIIHNEENGKVFLLLEYAYNGELLSWDEKIQKFKYNDPRKNNDYNFIQQIMRGTILVHSQNIVHRDIKPQNILVDAGDVAKICDFGTSQKLDYPDQKIKGSEGTYNFMAPESLKDNKQNGFDGKLADIYSLGVTFYCMIYQKLPFEEIQNLMALFNQIQYSEPVFQQGPPPELINIIKKMMAKNPKDRISLPQILEDPWFQVKYPAIDYDQESIDQTNQNINEQNQNQNQIDTDQIQDEQNNQKQQLYFNIHSDEDSDDKINENQNLYLNQQEEQQQDILKQIDNLNINKQ